VTDPDRRRRVDDVCDAALGLDPAEREVFLSSACGSDAALRREVEALLAHEPAADAFLSSSLGAVAAQILSEPDKPSFVGRHFGPYQILHLLGAGGMGEVYRAHDTTLGRDVAIKVVSDAFLFGPETVARFEREARVLATLNHPNIAAIYGIVEADGIRGLVLELVEGVTLAERLEKGPLTIREALTAAGQVADALDAAHEKSIIHRDLKPANIKLTPNGTVKVLDFGLAKVFEDQAAGLDPTLAKTTRASGSQDGLIAGTVAYMSTEQARGGALDKRTDIWAFGCVAYEMLTGRDAFPGDSPAETIARILESEPDWSLLPDKTPLAVRGLLRRCLEKDSKRRLRDIGDARLEIDEALGTLSSSGSVGASGTGRPGQANKPVRRARFVWLAGAGLLASVAVALWPRVPSEDSWRNPLEGATSTKLEDFLGAEHHASISRNGQFVAFLSDRQGTWDVWMSQVGTGELRNLTEGRVQELRNPGTRTLSFSHDGSSIILWNRVQHAGKIGAVDSGWAIPTMGGQLRPYLKGHRLSEFDFSPDGKRIVYHTPDPGDPMFITPADERDGRQIFIGRPGFHNHFPLWSHDGAFIYFVHGTVFGLPSDNSDVWRIRSGGGQPEQLTFHNSRVTFPTLLGNDTLLYLATDAEGLGPWIYTLDVKSRTFRRVSMGVDPYMSLAASEDGQRLVATVSRPTTRLWRVPIGERVAEESDASPIAVTTANSLSPRVGPGYIIYRAPQLRTHVLWKLSASGPPLEIWAGLDGPALSGAAVSRDGRRIAFPVKRPGVTQLYVMQADGTAATPIATDLDVRGTPAWSPDGNWLAVAAMRDGEPKLVKIQVAGGAWVPLVNEYSTDPVWAPNGQFLVYSGADVGTNFPVKAVGTDGTPRDVPKLELTRGARRLVFLDSHTLLMLKGDISHKDFWCMDLTTGQQRQLTNLVRTFSLNDFDISEDRREIIFDRSRDDSDIVLIERPRR
jgi:Tol biopolymer transport system component